MKNLFIFIFYLAISMASGAEDLVEIKALNGKVSIYAPKDFLPMPEKLLELKYPASRRPTEVLSDEGGGVTLAFNHTQNALRPAQVKEAHAVFSEMFHNAYPSATWLRDEVVTQNGQAFIVMELVTPAVDTTIHNIIYGTSVDSHLLLAAFNTTTEQSETWLPIGKKIMASMKILK